MTRHVTAPARRGSRLLPVPPAAPAPVSSLPTPVPLPPTPPTGRYAS